MSKLTRRKKGETQAAYERRVTGGYRLGVLPDKPDPRDYKFPRATPKEVAMLSAVVDLRPWDTAIRNQNDLGSCVAFAGLGVFEWIEKYKQPAKWFLSSPLALYRWALVYDGEGGSGDVGTYLRSACAVMATIGVAHESLWPYDEAHILEFYVDPPQEVIDDAANAKSTGYWSLSTQGGDVENPPTSVDDIKKAISLRLPVMFNFLLYGGYLNAGDYGGRIGMPTPNEEPIGRHANVVVGYNDTIQNRDNSYGAFIVRNSWDATWWGDPDHLGYGYMPYSYAPANMNDAWVIADESEFTPSFLKDNYEAEKWRSAEAPPAGIWWTPLPYVTCLTSLITATPAVTVSLSQSWTPLPYLNCLMSATTATPAVTVSIGGTSINIQMPCPSCVTAAFAPTVFQGLIIVPLPYVACLMSATTATPAVTVTIGQDWTFIETIIPDCTTTAATPAIIISTTWTETIVPDCTTAAPTVTPTVQNDNVVWIQTIVPYCTVNTGAVAVEVDCTVTMPAPDCVVPPAVAPTVFVALTVQPLLESGLILTYTTRDVYGVDPSDATDSIPNTGVEFIMLKCVGDAAEHTIIVSGKDNNGDPQEETYTPTLSPIMATFLGPFGTDTFGDKVTVTYDTTDNLYVSAIADVVVA